MTTTKEPQKIHEKPDFAKLMADGGGLSGFAWPENCGDFDMRIAVDGTWFYRGSPIGRMPLVKLFATVLQKDENGQYWLVTPVERGLVEVDDVPFVIVEMNITHEEGIQHIHLRTNLEHWITVDSDHALSMRQDPKTNEDKPYVHVRDGLDALINRAVYYDLVEIAEWQENRLVVKSTDATFLLGEMEHDHDD